MSNIIKTPDIELNISDTNDNDYIITISIDGMTCSSCSTTVKNAINKLNFVKKTSINLLTGIGNITINNDKVKDKINTIINTVDDMGFQAKLIDNNNNKNKVNIYFLLVN